MTRKEALKEIKDLMENYADAPINTSYFTAEKVLTRINDILSEVQASGSLEV